MTLTFAGFTYPRHVPILRMEKPVGKRLSTAYYINEPFANRQGWSFYLASDFAPGLRWDWCDEVCDRIEHTGWWTDEYGDFDKMRGVVFTLPHGKGFLAGWSMGRSMATNLEAQVYDDLQDAARAADKIAEDAAEIEREREMERQEN